MNSDRNHGGMGVLWHHWLHEISSSGKKKKNTVTISTFILLLVLYNIQFKITPEHHKLLLRVLSQLVRMKEAKQLATGSAKSNVEIVKDNR